MKPRGQHPDKALSAVRVRAVAEPGRYADGNGLYLVVDPSGAKRWVLRTVVRGKRRDVGLGGLRLVSLAEAREQALAFRKLARNGGDPLAERRRHRRLIPTFEEAARSVHGEHSVAWRNAKHAAQWFSTLAQYVFPTIAGRRVDQIETPDILRVLAPIWLTKPETARRVRQRIGTILDWAKAAGFRDGENPVAGVAKGLPKQPDRKAHHAALPYAEVPGFVAALDEVDISWSARLALSSWCSLRRAPAKRLRRGGTRSTSTARPGRSRPNARRPHGGTGSRCRGAAWRFWPMPGSYRAAASTSSQVGQRASRCRTWPS